MERLAYLLRVAGVDHNKIKVFSVVLFQKVADIFLLEKGGRTVIVFKKQKVSFVLLVVSGVLLHLGVRVLDEAMHSKVETQRLVVQAVSQVVLCGVDVTVPESALFLLEAAHDLLEFSTKTDRGLDLLHLFDLV
jgi:hypothetical protein